MIKMIMAVGCLVLVGCGAGNDTVVDPMDSAGAPVVAAGGAIDVAGAPAMVSAAGAAVVAAGGSVDVGGAGAGGAVNIGGSAGAAVIIAAAGGSSGDTSAAGMANNAGSAGSVIIAASTVYYFSTNCDNPAIQNPTTTFNPATIENPYNISFVDLPAHLKFGYCLTNDFSSCVLRNFILNSDGTATFQMNPARHIVNGQAVDDNDMCATDPKNPTAEIGEYVNSGQLVEYQYEWIWVM